ncbi:MAG: hypothetical protein IJ783_05360 [Kiritimatiellae bacterium]|nr:hypothetical protein [Kiritimatiellia bacterium]
MKKTDDKQTFPPPRRRGRQPSPASERRRKEEERRRADAVRPRYTCAGCGRTFRIPDFKNETGDRRFYVVLGGRKYCSKCAAERQPRRGAPALWAQGENCIHTPQKGAIHR